ncbi:MAG: hypothetical protein QE285_17955 [Aquabacterium sp.]|nr:hypothetical protein [Aquabacterium sp.]
MPQAGCFQRTSASKPWQGGGCLLRLRTRSRHRDGHLGLQPHLQPPARSRLPQAAQQHDLPASALRVDTFEPAHIDAQALGVGQRFFGFAQQARQVGSGTRLGGRMRPTSSELRVDVHVGAGHRRRQHPQHGQPHTLDLSIGLRGADAPHHGKGARTQMGHAPTQHGGRFTQPAAQGPQQGIACCGAEHIVDGGQARDIEQQRRVGAWPDTVVRANMARSASSTPFAQQTRAVRQARDGIRERDRLDTRVSLVQRLGHGIQGAADALDLARPRHTGHAEPGLKIACRQLARGVRQAGHRPGDATADAPRQQRGCGQGQQRNDHQLCFRSLHAVGCASLPGGDGALLCLRQIAGQGHQPVERRLALGGEQGRSPRRLTRFDPDTDLGEDLTVALAREVERLHEHQRLAFGDALLQFCRQSVHRSRFGVQRRIDAFALGPLRSEQPRHRCAVALRVGGQILQGQQARPLLARHPVGGQLHGPQVPGRQRHHQQQQRQQGGEGCRELGGQGLRATAQAGRADSWRVLGGWLDLHLNDIGRAAGGLSGAGFSPWWCPAGTDFHEVRAVAASG